MANREIKKIPPALEPTLYLANHPRARSNGRLLYLGTTINKAVQKHKLELARDINYVLSSELVDNRKQRSKQKYCLYIASFIDPEQIITYELTEFLYEIYRRPGVFKNAGSSYHPATILSN